MEVLGADYRREVCFTQPPTGCKLHMEVLGAVASAAQLATMCFSFQQRLCQLSADKRHLAKVVNGCTELSKEIDNLILQLPSEVRKHAKTLSDHLSDIILDIERLQKRRFVKFITILQLRGKEFEARLQSALTEFQVHAVLSGNQILEEIRMHIGTERLSAETHQKMDLVKTSLDALQENHTGLRERIEELTAINTKIQSTAQKTLVVVQDTHNELFASRQDMSFALSEIGQIRRELQMIQSQLPAIHSIWGSSAMDRITVMEPSACLDEHLKHQYSSSTLATEMEIYEVLRDIVLSFLTFYTTGDDPPLIGIDSFYKRSNFQSPL